MNNYIKTIIIQKLTGLFLLAGSAYMIYDAMKATNIEDKDCTALIILIPLGLFALLCNKPFEDLGY